MIEIVPETRIKCCNSCGRTETDHKDNGFKTIKFKVGDNAGSSIVILCPKCFELLGQYVETVLREEDDKEIHQKTCFVCTDV
jgi:hypothetical protein